MISDAEAFYGEISAVPLVVPTLVLKDRLTIRRSSRTVEIILLGKAHTDGDTVVYLPKEKVLFTGDLTHGLMPYMGDSYPYGWIQALDELLKLDIEYVFGGHGDLIKGKDVLRLWRDYLSDVMAETAAAYAQGMPLKEAQAFVAPRLEGKYAARFPPGVFKNQIANNVEKAYEVTHMR